MPQQAKSCDNCANKIDSYSGLSCAAYTMLTDGLWTAQLVPTPLPDAYAKCKLEYWKAKPVSRLKRALRILMGE